MDLCGSALASIADPESTGRLRVVLPRDPSRCTDNRLCSVHGAILLYIGISPSAPTNERQTAEQAIAMASPPISISWNAEGSTRRLTLGCLLPYARLRYSLALRWTRA